MTPIPRRRFHPLVPIVIALAALLAFVVRPAPADAAGSGRVVNGTVVDASTYAARWSSIVALVRRSEDDVRTGQFCGGTLVAPRLVVTAAHCVSDPSKLLALQDFDRDKIYNNARAAKPGTMQVVAGRRVLGVVSGQRINVSQVLIHPRYDPETSDYDVAVLRLASAPAASLGVRPVRPVAEGEDGIWGAGAGLAATPTDGPWVAGWGYRSDPLDDFEGFSSNANTPYHRPTRPVKRSGKAGRSSIANSLESALLTIRSDAACDTGGVGEGTGYGRIFNPATMLCAGTLDTSDANDENALSNGVDSCYGDSGGPVLASTGAALRLVGIVSFGAACADRSTYGVYTRVSAMRPFLSSADPKQPVTLKARPRATGMASPGRALRCSPGRWAGAGKIRYSYRWIRTADDERLSESAFFTAEEAYERLPGSATTRTYRVRARDRGTKIGCLVIATNGATTAAENSVLVKVPGPAPVDPEEEERDESDDDEGGFFF